MTLSLAIVLDTAAAGPLRAALQKAIDQERSLLIDGSAVERAGQACLQVLVAAEDAAMRAGLAFGIVDPAPALVDMAALADLGFLLTV